jgi:GT2 family glycosyltransferase
VLSDHDPVLGGAPRTARATTSYCVTIPTRDRPQKLAECLAAVSASTGLGSFEILVCDSSTDDLMRAEVSRVCRKVPNVRLVHHNGSNAAMARNTATRLATADLIISIDDDVRVEPDAIRALVNASRLNPDAMVAGTVRWGERWSTPVKTRPIGYGRAVSPREQPDFLVSAFFAYPRELNLRIPWNEHLRREEDRCFGSQLRSHGVPLVFAPDARAVHHDEHNSTGAKDIGDRIYANLFEAVVVRRSSLRALSFLLVGFLFSAREFGVRHLPTTVVSWLKGVRSFVRDLPQLRATSGDRASGSSARHLTTTGPAH